MAPLDREREAQEEMARTEVRRPVAALLIALFLATLPLLAILDWITPGRANREVRVHWPTRAELANAKWKGGWRGLNLELKKFIEDVDTWFERGNDLGLRLRPPVQTLLLERLSYGNGQVRSARDGWLFWENEIQAVTGPGFLEPAMVARQRYRGAETDPATAIVDLGTQLAARGVPLVVLPVPPKVSVEHVYLGDAHGRAATERRPLENASMPELRRRLAAEGIDLFDPAPLLAARAHALPQYLKSDSHWSPDAMGAVAKALAVHLREKYALEPTLEVRLAAAPQTRFGGHDLMGLLGLPIREAGPRYEAVTLQQVQVVDEEHHPRDSTAGGVLLLGDSYAKIYSVNFEGWGAGAGLPDRLTYELRRPVARILRDAGLDSDSRAALVRELEADPHLLDSIRVVIYELAVRELSLARWKRVALPPAPATPSRQRFPALSPRVDAPQPLAREEPDQSNPPSPE